MPILKQASKKLRRDQRRTTQNQFAKNQINRAVKNMRKTPAATTLFQVFSLLDKAVKRHLMHKNKASRLKSRLSLRLNK